MKPIRNLEQNWKKYTSFLKYYGYVLRNTPDIMSMCAPTKLLINVIENFSKKYLNYFF